MLRSIKIILVLSVAVWGTLSAFGNFTHWSGTLEAVGAATSMATFEGGAESWQATTNPVVIMAGAVYIVSLKILTAFLCFVGAQRMWSARKDSAQVFSDSKTIALTGCGVGVFLLFFGWIVIAETWFELWRSDVLRGPVLDSAFRYGGFIALIGIFVGARDE